MINIINSSINTINTSKHDEFVKGLDNMFDTIYDCEINHPLFQDTVGELMQAVVELYDKLHPCIQEENQNGN